MAASYALNDDDDELLTYYLAGRMALIHHSMHAHKLIYLLTGRKRFHLPDKHRQNTEE